MHLELVDPYSAGAEHTWRALEAVSPPSFFLSWGWVSTWLACLPRYHAPLLAVIGAGGAPLAAGLVARKRRVRSRIVPSRTLFLNTTGVARFDHVFIEYNGLVGRRLSVEDVVAALPPTGWDELVMNALDAEAFTDLRTAEDARFVIDREVPVHYVDVARARRDGYLAQLSSQTRTQVRRAQREAGKLGVEVAKDLGTAIDIYSELVALHQAQWRTRGEPGAFADPWFDRFHRTLIVRRFRAGEIQLIRVRHATGTIGCLYNFVHRGRVLQYQSGFAPFANERLKPGFVCHAAAIEHAMAGGQDIYDFLAGDQRYKKQLATDATKLVWARVQRRRLRFFVERQLRRWRARNQTT